MDDVIDEALWDEAAADLDRAGEALAACRLDEARSLAEGARDALLALLGPGHPDYANALDTLGLIAAAEGDPTEAIACFRAALAVYDAFTDEDDAAVVRPLRAQTLANLGDQRMRAGDAAAAEPLVREALAEAVLAYGPEALEVAVFQNGLGVLLRFAGQYAEAELAYGRAAEIRAVHGEPQPSTHFHNLSGLASARGDFVRAEAYARSAIALSEANPGDGLGLGADLCGLADALAGQERHDEARIVYRRALALYAASSRPDHPEVAYALHNLGDCLAALGRAREAEDAYVGSIGRKLALFGDAHPEIAASLANLAALYAETGRASEARATLRRASELVGGLGEASPIRQGVLALARSLGA